MTKEVLITIQGLQFDIDAETDEELDQLAPWNGAVKEEIQHRVDSQNNE